MTKEEHRFSHSSPAENGFWEQYEKERRMKDGVLYEDPNDDRDVKFTSFGKWLDNSAKARIWHDIAGEPAIRDLWGNKLQGMKWTGKESKRPVVDNPLMDYSESLWDCRMGKAKAKDGRCVLSISVLPSRITETKQRIYDVIQTIVNQTIKFDAVYFVMPRKFERASANGCLPLELFDLDRGTDWFHIVREIKDYGPITKYLAPIIFEDDPETTCFVQDDDTFMPDGNWYRVMLEHMRKWNSMVGTMGAWCRWKGETGGAKYSLTTGGRDQVEWPNGTFVDSLMGVGSVGFKRGWIDDKRWMEYCDNLDPHFHFHDARDHKLWKDTSRFMNDDIVVGNLTKDIPKRIVSKGAVKGKNIDRFAHITGSADSLCGTHFDDTPQGEAMRGLCVNWQGYIDMASCSVGSCDGL